MTGGTTIDVLVGLGMPLLIALINQSHWPPMLKGTVAFVSCAAAAAAIEWVRGDVSWADWRTALVYVLGSALFFYQTLWRPAQITSVLEAVTTIRSPVDQA